MRLTSLDTFWSTTPIQVGDLRLIVDHPMQARFRSPVLIEYNRQQEGKLLIVTGIYKQKLIGRPRKSRNVIRNLLLNDPPVETSLDEQYFYYTELISRAQNEEILPG